MTGVPEVVKPDIVWCGGCGEGWQLGIGDEYHGRGCPALVSLTHDYREAVDDAVMRLRFDARLGDDA